MPSDFVDLGVSPSPETSIEIKSELDSPKKSYPCLYVNSQNPIDLGEAGTAEIKYRLVEKTERSKDGKDEYRYELEIHGISPMDTMEVDEEMAGPKKKEGLTQSFGEVLEKFASKRNAYQEE